jgi:hypothetical protein
MSRNSGKGQGGRSTVGLGLLFGAIYFVQGVGEPVEGLVAQPVRSILKGWGKSNAEITTFAALLAIPWSLKPLYGLLSDAVPLAGSRRRSYLILSSVVTVAGMGVVYALPMLARQVGTLLAWLLVPTVAVAFSDVVADALMVEVGRPRGLTGTLQSVQWACLYAATVATGLVGGYLSEHKLERLGFLICGALGFVTLVLAVFALPEAAGKAIGPREALRSLGGLARSPGLWSVGGFLFLWNFNPFSQTVLYLHMTRALGLGEQFYGQTVSLLALASIAASVAYGFYCRRVAMRTLVHASIVLGISATLAHWLLVDRPTAVGVTIAVGLTYMTATIIQLDLAARACPPEVAGTAFATLMALENLANLTSTWLGGLIYEWGTARWGAIASFNVLVGVGGAFTAGCWALVPLLPGVTLGEGTINPTSERPGSGPGRSRDD